MIFTWSPWPQHTVEQTALLPHQILIFRKEDIQRTSLPQNIKVNEQVYSREYCDQMKASQDLGV